MTYACTYRTLCGNIQRTASGKNVEKLVLIYFKLGLIKTALSRRTE